MDQLDKNTTAPRRNPFRGMLIFAIIIFIVAWLLYRNRAAVPGVKPGSADTTKSSMITRDTTHRE
jgi:hypothetical protein